MIRKVFLLCITMSAFIVSINAKPIIKSDQSYELGVFDDQSNKWMIPPKFNSIIEIQDPSEPYYACRFQEKYAIYNNLGQRFTHFAFDDIYRNRKKGPMIVVKQNGFWGIVGGYWIIIPFEYKDISLDGAGNTQLQRIDRLTETMSMSDFLRTAKKAMAEKKEYSYDIEFENLANWYVNLPTTSIPTSAKSLKETPETKHFMVSNVSQLSISVCSHGYFIVRETNTNKTFIFNDKGENVGKLNTLKYELFNEDNVALMVLPDHSLVIVNPDGSIKENFGRYYSYFNFVDGKAKADLSGKTIIFNSEGKQLLNLDNSDNVTNKIYEWIFQGYSLCEDMRKYSDRGRYGFLNRSNQIAIAAKFNDAEDFSEGLAAVSIVDGQQKLWGYIDKQGHYVIQPKFSIKPSSFHNGLAVVTKKNGNQCYIDKEGQVVSREYKYLSDFYEGYSFAKHDFSKRLLVGKQDREIICDTYCDRQCCYCSQGKLINHNYIYSPAGEPLVKLNGSVGKFEEPITYCRAGSKTGYINMEGEWILIFDQDEF